MHQHKVPPLLTPQKFLALNFEERRNYLLDMIEHDATRAHESGRRWYQGFWGEIPAAGLRLLRKEGRLRGVETRNTDGWSPSKVAVVDIPTDAHCGSAFCLAGNAVVSAGLPLALEQLTPYINSPTQLEAEMRFFNSLAVDHCLSPSGEYERISEVAQKLLGLDDTAARALFAGSNDLPMMRKLIAEINRGDGTLRPEAFCPECMNFIEPEHAC